MQVVFKNSKEAKNCQIFISQLKKLRFFFGSKEKRIYFKINQSQFRMTTQIKQNLQSPHLESQNQFIDYKFGKGCYSLMTNLTETLIFSLDIDFITKGITHYQQTKMNTLWFTVETQAQPQATIRYQLGNQDLQGEIVLKVKIQNEVFPAWEQINKEQIKKISLFEIQSSNAEKINYVGGNSWLQFNMNGIYLKKYNQLNINTNEYLISKQLLSNYNIQNIKKALSLRTHISEKNDRLLQQIHRCGKKRYSKCQVYLWLVQHPQQDQSRYEYLQIRSIMSNLGGTVKYVTSKCTIARESNVIQSVAYKPILSQNNLLKAEDQGLEFYKNIVLNKFQPEHRYRSYLGQEKEVDKVAIEISGDNQETHTRKIIFKIED